MKSEWAPVSFGVPKGTFFFLCYSHCISTISQQVLSREIRLFADDCVCYREIKEYEDTVKLQPDIDQLGAWARVLGFEISIRQMQYDAADKEMNHK